MHIFSHEYRTSVKRNIVNKMLELYHKHKNPKYSDDLYVFVIKSLHMYHPITCMLIMSLGSKWLAMQTFYSIIGVFALFLYLNGCFLTSLEYKINELDVTIADPIIMLFGGDINAKNRVVYSVTTIVIYLLVAAFVLFYRFYQPSASLIEV